MEKVKIPNLSTAQVAELLHSRQTFLVNKFFLPDFKASGITHWEEMTCVGYDPEKSKLEAIVSIKQQAGYNGGLCTNGSKEYVRFFVDFNDGNGFQDMGYTSFKVADISEAPPGPQHPIMYMAQLFIDDTKYRKLLNCNTAVIPKVKAVLSWNNIPSSNLLDVPYYGNILEANIQLKRKNIFKWVDIFSLLNVKLKTDALPFNLNEEITLPTKQILHLSNVHESYKAAKVPDHRTFFSTLAPLVSSSQKFKTVSGFNLSDLKNLNINIKDITDLILKPVTKADVSFEELTCIGLNTSIDTLGGVVKIKKSSGFSGDLCHAGSEEFVAFWADWNNSGTFEYVGTTSVTVHDIGNVPVDGLYYNVSLPINVTKRLKTCISTNTIRIRGVLSWQSLPSTTDPNHLNTWGNRLDAIVQIRPGSAQKVETELTYVGGIDRDDIHPTQFLYNANNVNPTIYNNRPFGGVVNFHGIIQRNGFGGIIKYKIMFKKYGASDATYATVSTSESFQMIDFAPDPNLEWNDIQNPADGWFEYKENPDIGLYNQNHYLAGWNTNSLADGTYTIKFVFTDEFGVEQTGDLFSMIISNEHMSISMTANAAVDVTKSLDLVIDGGDCHCYDKSPAKNMVNGHLRAVHKYFGWWGLDLQPSSHAHGVTPNPSSRYYNALANAGNAGNLGDTTDNGDENLPWSLNVSGGGGTGPLDNCGYTVSLWAHSRVIRDSSTVFPWYGLKAVGFSVTDKCLM